jgi:hypothetical protein
METLLRIEAIHHTNKSRKLEVSFGLENSYCNPKEGLDYPLGVEV